MMDEKDRNALVLYRIEFIEEIRTVLNKPNIIDI